MYIYILDFNIINCIPYIRIPRMVCFHVFPTLANSKITRNPMTALDTVPQALDRRSFFFGLHQMTEGLHGSHGSSQNNKSGCWYTYPSEKYESQLGWIIPYIMEK